MAGFLALLKRFHSDERGVFIVLFGVMAIVLVATAGAVVDFTSIEQARTKAQIALDSAALGLQPTIFDKPAPTEQSLRENALALLNERLADPNVTASVTTATYNVGNGTLHLEASIVVPTAFVQLVGIQNVTARVISEATRKRLNLEIALVLDNSKSMETYVDTDGNGRKNGNEKSRMDSLKEAAICAMNVLYNAVGDCLPATMTANNSKAATEANIWLGLVPFTGFVKVGTGYSNAAWLDKTGASSISNDNFDNDDNDETPFTGTVNRFNLFSAMNTSWSGCVEARPYPYDTNDTAPTSGDTLFVPEFAPDTPDSGGYSNTYKTDRPNACSSKKDLASWGEVKVKTNCTSTWANNASETTKKNTYDSCASTASATRTQKKYDGTNVAAASVSATQPAKLAASAAANDWNYPTCTDLYESEKTSTGNNPARYRLTYTRSCTYPFSDRELQERLCKYTGNVSGGSPSPDCPSNALQPLTATKSKIKTAIDAMSPQGYTNIHQGTIWGFHMLSPTEPLTEAKDYDAATSKVMIVMTDGENTVDSYGSNMNYARTFQAYGWPGPPVDSGTAFNGRLYSSATPKPATEAELTAAMDTRTLETCGNAKTAGIVIYTIGLNAPNQKTIDLLTNCATTPAHAYFPTASTQLTQVFKDIADELANLRLSL